MTEFMSINSKYKIKYLNLKNIKGGSKLEMYVFKDIFNKIYILKENKLYSVLFENNILQLPSLYDFGQESISQIVSKNTNSFWVLTTDFKIYNLKENLEGKDFKFNIEELKLNINLIKIDAILSSYLIGLTDKNQIFLISTNDGKLTLMLNNIINFSCNKMSILVIDKNNKIKLYYFDFKDLDKINFIESKNVINDNNNNNIKEISISFYDSPHLAINQSNSLIVFGGNNENKKEIDILNSYQDNIKKINTKYKYLIHGETNNLVCYDSQYNEILNNEINDQIKFENIYQLVYTSEFILFGYLDNSIKIVYFDSDSNMKIEDLLKS